MKKTTTSSKSSPSDPIEARIKDIDELKLVITAAFYGRSGTGKTTVSSTFPTPMLVLDVSEKGTDSIRDIPGIKMITIECWEDIEDTYWYIRDNPTKFKTVSMDSCHAAQSMAINFIKKERGAKEMEQTTKHDFMRASGLMQQWILAYRDLESLGINVIFIAHDRLFNAGEESESDDGTLAPEVGPRLMPSVNSVLVGSVKVVGNTFIREREIAHEGPKRLGVKRRDRVVEYCMRIGPNSYYTTKIRSPKTSPVPSFLVDPDYASILEVMKGLPSPEGEQSPPVRRRRINT